MEWCLYPLCVVSDAQRSSSRLEPSTAREHALIDDWMSSSVGFITAPVEVISTLTSKIGSVMKRKEESEREATRCLSASSDARVHCSTASYL